MQFLSPELLKRLSEDKTLDEETRSALLSSAKTTLDVQAQREEARKKALEDKNKNAQPVVVNKVDTNDNKTDDKKTDDTKK